MNKFKVGDPVKIRKGITNEDMGTNYPCLDLDKVYHISAVEGTGYHYHLKETHPGYCFCTDWLEPAHGIERVLFNKPATIVFWADGTKTVVKCRKGDKWDAEKGLAMACAKKLLGNDDGYHQTLAKHYCNSEPTPDEMRLELHKYCKGKWCGNCIMDEHRKDPRCVCGMGHSFTLDKNSPAYISDADIRFFYKWLKDGLRDG